MNTTSGKNTIVYDVFQPGLIRGSAELRHAPGKQYAYVEHPTEGWRVYLRSASFLHDMNNIQPLKFIIVKASHKASYTNAWEPPKGQMEGKDLPSKGELMNSLYNNASREVNEETGIPFQMFDLQHTGLVFQGKEKDYPEGHVFQYHIFRGVITPDAFDYAKNRFQYYRENPREFQALVKDYREKDDIDWYSTDIKLFGKWSPSIIMLYINAYITNNVK